MDEEVLLKALYEKLYTGMLEKDGEAILSCMTEDAGRMGRERLNGLLSLAYYVIS